MQLSSTYRNIIDYYKKHTKLVFLWLVTFFISLFYSPYLSSLIAALPLAYLLTNKITAPKFFSTKFYTAAISVILYISIFQIALYLGWFIFPGTTILGASVVTIALILLIVLLLPPNKAPKNSRKTINRFDLIAIIGGILVLLFVAGVPLYKSVKLNAENPLVNLMMRGGVDSSAHLSILNDRIQFDKGVLLGTDDLDKARNKGQGYPIGWHSANALFIKSAKPTITPGIESANFYVITTLFWLFAIVYFLIRTSSALAKNILGPNVSLISLCTLLSIGVFATIVFFSDIFIHGFYSYFPVLITSILFIPSIITLFNSKNTDELCRFTVLPALLLSLSALSWLLVSPIFGIAIIFAIIESIRNMKGAKKIPYSHLLSILFICIIVLASVVIQTKNTSAAETGSTASSFISTVLIDGGIAKYDIGFYIVVTGLGVLYFKYASKKETLPVVLYIAAAALFISLIYFIQQYKQQYNSYYYYKLLFVIITTFWTIGIAGIATLVDKLRASSIITPLAVSVALPMLLVFIFIPSSNVYNYSFGINTPSIKYTDQLVRLSEKYHTMSDYGNRVISIYDPAGDRGPNEIGSVFLRTNSQNNECYSILLKENYTIPPEDFGVSALLNEKCKGFHAVYVVRSSNIGIAKQSVKAANLKDRVTLISLDQ